jgi:hypothetical protein
LEAFGTDGCCGIVARIFARSAFAAGAVGGAARQAQPFISYVESGERRLDVIEFYAIVMALGLEPIELFTRIVAKLPKQVDI